MNKSILNFSAAFALVGGFVACSTPANEASPDGGTPVTGGSSTGGTNGQVTGGAAGSASSTGGSTSAGGAGGSSVGGAGGGAGLGVGGSTGTGGASGGGGIGGTGAGSGGTLGIAGMGATGPGGGAGGGGGAGSMGNGGVGNAGGGGSAPVGGTGGGGGQSTGFQKAAGTIPNSPQPASKVNLPESSWQQGIVSPTMNAGKQINQPSVMNGYLMVGGNEEFWIYDVSNPAMPRQLSNFSTPNKTGGEAESHTVSFARYGNNFYMVTIGGRGIDTWDVTNVSSPRHLAQLPVPGTNYGDYTEAIWGVTWQGQYIYVGATNNGIKVVDAQNPASLSIVKEVPTSQYGGVSAGPIDAIGNVLVVTTPKESAGIATLDISDPVNPTRLASLTSTSISYIGMFYRHWVFLQSPVRAWDVLTNPRSIGSGSSPLGSLATEGSEYMSFADDYMFLGHVRAEINGKPGASKITVADPRNMRVTSRVWGRMNLANKNDDQFSITLGNLLFIGDDQSPYHGWFIAVHQADPDRTAPVVDTVIPKNATTAVSTKTRIGVSLSDNIDLATVNAASFIVRPMGGQPLPGKFGVRMGVVSFDPDQDLAAGTTYEVVLPSGGLADLVGNTLAAEWKSTFTTQ